MRITPDEKKTIHELHAAGLTVVEIHKQTGIPKPTIYNQLRLCGKRPNYMRFRSTPEQKRKLAEVYRSSGSVAEAARAAGVSYMQAWYYLTNVLGIHKPGRKDDDEPT